jgi:putative flippase GtrA
MKNFEVSTIKNKLNKYSKKHPKLSKFLYQFLKFYIFSLLVTLLQYLMLTFLPGILFSMTDWMGKSFQLIHIKFWIVDSYVFDYPVTGDATGGLGYFIAFAVTLFVAQVINFPLQRTITFKSKGNIAYQMMWFFIAWVLITITCSFLVSIYVPILKKFLATAVYNIVITVVNGGVSMVIYFPILKIIFPEGSKSTTVPR